MPGQERDTREKSKKGGDSNHQAETRKIGYTSAASSPGPDNPNHFTDFDAIEIFNKTLA